jgi:hypothetical protein
MRERERESNCIRPKEILLVAFYIFLGAEKRGGGGLSVHPSGFCK